MSSFSTNYISKLTIPVGTSIIHGLCAESKGKEDLWSHAQPDMLAVLREESVISSTESSNRIEGVEVDSDRLVPLVSGKALPRDRPEEEIVGYRNALRFIHEHAQTIEITPETVKELHRLAQAGSIADAGDWKTRNNEIIEIHPDGRRSVRFQPPPPDRIPQLMSDLCLGYRSARSNDLLPDLFLAATFVFDFLCIHPFRDGNGRVSRLLFLLLLYQHRYSVGRYISLEKIVEDSREDYYEALKKSSVGWHQQTHDLTPIWTYLLRTVRIAYEQLNARVATIGVTQGGKSDLVRSTILRMPSNFTLKNIASLERGMTQALIRKVLYQLRNEGKVVLIGKGRGATWRVQK